MLHTGPLNVSFFIQLDYRLQRSLYVCSNPTTIIPIVIIRTYYYFFHQRSLYLFWKSLSHSLYLTLFFLLCLSPFLHFWLVVSTWWIASKWRMLWVPYFERFCLQIEDIFPPTASVPPIPSSTPPSLSPLLSISHHHLCHCTNVRLSSPLLSLSPLSGGAGRECHGVGGRHSPDLLPPAELRWINRGHPESPPADSFLQRHKRCVAVCAVVFPQINSFSSAALTFALYFFLSHFLFAYVLNLPLKRFHIKKSDNPGVNLRDGVILCPNSATTLTALKA